MTETPPSLDALLRIAAPAGYERPASLIWREAAEKFGRVETDGLGSSIVYVGEEDASPLVAFVGHIDEIGLVVTHIDEKGFAWFTTIGGWDPQVLVGQRVVIEGRDGPVMGVVGRIAIHLLEQEQRKKVVEIKGMHIDIGASSEDEARERIGVGDPVVIAAEPVSLIGSRLASKSMDNRLGSYIALEAARRCAESDKLAGRVAGIAAAQEEIGLNGSKTVAYQVRPDLAVAIDVTHATDAPGVNEKEHGSHALGSGPVIARGSTLSPRVYDLLVAAAESAGIEYTVEASGRYTGTDADSIQISRAGVPTGLVSIPLRYMHSPVEVCDLEDVENVVRLLVALAESLTPDVDLTR